MDNGVPPAGSGSRKSSQQAVSPVPASIPNADWRGSPEMHPWHHIAEELLARGWSVQDLAIRMADPDYEARIHEIGVNLLTLDLYRYVGPDNHRCTIGEKAGRQIARAFRVHDDLIVNLDREWRRHASGTDARSGETAGLDPKDDGPVPQGDAQPPQGDPK